MEKTVKCPICEDPYKIYDSYAGDQSACPDCIAKAQEKELKRMNRSTQYK